MADEKAKVAGKAAANNWSGLSTPAADSRPRPSPFDRAYQEGRNALDALNHLKGRPRPVELAWKTHFLGDLRAVNNNFMDTYILKGQNSVLDADIDLIERVGDEYLVHVTFSHAGGHASACLRGARRRRSERTCGLRK